MASGHFNEIWEEMLRQYDQERVVFVEMKTDAAENVSWLHVDDLNHRINNVGHEVVQGEVLNVREGWK